MGVNGRVGSGSEGPRLGHLSEAAIAAVGVAALAGGGRSVAERVRLLRDWRWQPQQIRPVLLPAAYTLDYAG